MITKTHIGLAFLAVTVAQQGCSKTARSRQVKEQNADSPFVFFDRSDAEYEYVLVVSLPEVVLQKATFPSARTVERYRLSDVPNEVTTACRGLRVAEGSKEGTGTFEPPGPWYARYASTELVLFPNDDSRQIAEWSRIVREYLLKQGQSVDRLPEWVTQDRKALRLVERPIAAVEQTTTRPR